MHTISSFCPVSCDSGRFSDRAQNFYQGFQITKIFVTFGLLFLALSADAETLHYSSPSSTYVIAIENLDIGGTLYNVDFDADAYSTFGGDDKFWATEAEASAAVDAINALFEAHNVYGVYNEGIPDCLSSPCYTVNFGSDYGVLAYAFGEWINAGSVAGGSEFDPLVSAWSIAVPVPGAAWLFASALTCLGWLRRKQTASL